MRRTVKPIDDMTAAPASPKASAAPWAVSAAGDSRPIKLRISQTGEGPLDKRGTLHVVAIGIDQYPGLGNACGPNRNATCDLTYAGNDAQLFAATIKRELGPRHKKGVKVRLLTNGGRWADRPTAVNILKAIIGNSWPGTIRSVSILRSTVGRWTTYRSYYYS